ncbi:MAG: heterodisulfide reductase-related iron-sulfur binding cluster, partial [Thermodesulfobacteriota bacterium]|nr:heterodisulfide reductase-related iron-sulfur binding cluster [Thermodesulfobacteriota bacterium]
IPYGYGILEGTFYSSFSFALDISGFLVLAGVFMALLRRKGYAKLCTGSSTKEDDIILILLFFIVMTGFFVEGLRIAGTGRPEYERWSPLGYAISSLFIGFNEGMIRHLHKFLWICHMVLSCSFIALIPFTKLRHIIFVPLNIFFSSLSHQGVLPSSFNLYVDTEEQIVKNNYPLGVNEVTGFKRWQLLSCDACTQCGECERLCPAYQTEKPLSPREIIVKIRKLSHSRAHEPLTLINDLFSLDELSSCTTCYACAENCPVLINPLSIIIELKRNLVFEGVFENGHAVALRRTSSEFNPNGMSPGKRTEMLELLGIEQVKEGETYDMLYWLGCSAYFDERSQDIAKAVYRVLKRSGVRVAALGGQEKCCGDFARRVGDEGLFQRLALDNIKTIKRFGFDVVITHCPHGFNTLKNEYPAFGADFKIYHHSEFITKLLKNGSIKIAQKKEMLAYHDPCYLGRYNNIYKAPREILMRYAGSIIEFPLCKNESFCCGAGGGHMWKHKEIGIRINDQRIEQALETGVRTITTACPFCLAMFEDSLLLKGRTNVVDVRDIAELVEGALC